MTTTTTEPRTWLLQFKPPAPFLSDNTRTDRRAAAADRSAWRAASAAHARRLKLPTGLHRVRIDVVVWLPDGRDVDTDNLRATTKALVDGLGPPFIRKPNPAKGYGGASAAGYRLIPNDNRKHLDGPHLTITDEPMPPIGQVDLYVTDLTTVPAGRSWTPAIRIAAKKQRLRTKRCCNGCGQRIGDVLDEEIQAVMEGRPLPDVRDECPTCEQHNEGEPQP